MTETRTESFLPFDLEFAFSASMILSIVQAILPTFVPDPNWLTMVELILGAMIQRGSVVAGLRKAELQHLNLLLAPLHQKGFTPPGSTEPFGNTNTGDQVQTHPSDLYAEIDWDPILTIGLDSELLSDLALQLEVREGDEDLESFLR